MTEPKFCAGCGEKFPENKLTRMGVGVGPKELIETEFKIKVGFEDTYEQEYSPDTTETECLLYYCSSGCHKKIIDKLIDMGFVDIGNVPGGCNS